MSQNKSLNKTLSRQLPEPMEVNAQLRDQRWEETSDCCTVAWICDGFYCEGMSLLLHSITLEALLERSPPSSAHLESRFLGSVSTSDKALMVTCQTTESLQ